MSGPCWSEHGAYRAAFLEQFSPEDRRVLRRAGAILAARVLSRDTHHEPIVLSEFRAALEDARMLREYLRQIAETSVDELESEAAEHLAREAWYWQRQTDDLAHGMAASLQNATGEWPEESGIEPAVEAAEVGFESAAPAGAPGDLTAEEARPHLAALGRFLAALGVSLGEVAARMGRKGRRGEP
jgi:serine/threonine protein kinase HipA of HipAB toxin-antitoxin module